MSTVDAATLITTGVYSYSNGLQYGLPVNDGILVVVAGYSRATVQFYIHNSKCWYRLKHYWVNDFPTTWESLSLNIPDFYKNYANENALAIAIGVERVTQLTDFNDMPLNSVCSNTFSTVENAAEYHVPNGEWGTLYTYGSSNNKSQIYIAYRSNNVYVRSFYQDSWSAWQTLQLS